jgi:sugar phosphate isomerase/epimerase
MPKLAAFPKAFINELCTTGSMSLSEWIEMASHLDIDGLEWYSGFLGMEGENNWIQYRSEVEKHEKVIPMMCCSPDFTHPDAAFRNKEVEKQKKWIDMTFSLGGSYCRVLSGQRRGGLTDDEGVKLAADCIKECLPYAQDRNVILTLENHYKDGFWEFPEFAQKMDIFCKLADSIDHPFFGINYDPSNTYLAGEDPVELLKRISHRVVTMHASDRYLAEGTLDDLRNEERGIEGYAKRLNHGEIGKGLNDYDAIFTELKSAGFDGWISIEDGIEGMDQLKRSVAFLRNKLKQYWPAKK